MAAVNMNKELFEQMMAGDKPLLVDFWAPWCGYCRRIGPAYEKIADQYQDILAVAKVNVDEVPEIAEAQKIDTLPTLVLYKNGQALGSIVAPDSKAKIDAFIRETLGL
ncbi:MAG: thioredoxin family protein [Oscillospiraceae bacterium]|nr:thioredoxin family protein [Oscillospiraceae bacterium]